MNLEFTAVFRKVPQGYIGFVEELPGANTQGVTLERPEGTSRRPLRSFFKPTGRSPKRTRRGRT